MWRTRVCNLLGIEYPIIEGGMAIPGNGELAAAVSNAGGLGVIGVNPLAVADDKQLENLRDHIRRAKALSTKPFAINVPIDITEQMGGAQATMDLILEEEVPVVVTGSGDPRRFIQQLHSKGVKVLHVCLSLRHAVVAQQAGVDAVIVAGSDAGGRLAPVDVPTVILVPIVVDALDIPVVAAGGFADGRGLVTALALGADAVQMGTRFLATRECCVHEKYKQAIVEARETDTIVTRSTVPPRVRSLRNPFITELAAMERRAAGEAEIQSFISQSFRAKEAEINGDMTDGDPICGVSAALVHEILPAGEVVRRIIREAEAVLQRCHGMLPG